MINDEATPSERSLRASSASGGSDVLSDEATDVHVGDVDQARPRYDGLKQFAKVLSKRFAIRLSSAQEMLCRASGFDGMNHLHQLPRTGDGNGSDPHEEVSFQVWSSRLRSELGADFEELLAAEKQLTWWKRLHGRREAAVELQCPWCPAWGIHG